jgi:predicted phosphodiesterase
MTHSNSPSSPVRYLVFGGPGGNLQATQAIYKVAQDLKLPPERVICTGDSVAHGGNPNETIALLNKWGVRAIQGNIEEQLIVNGENSGCGFIEGSINDTLAKSWYGFLQKEINEDSFAWMRRLPKTLHFVLAGKRVAVVHGGFTGLAKYFFRSTSWAVKQQEFVRADANLILAGHSGLPFLQQQDQCLWANAGSLGLPANDGTPRVWYMTMTESAGQLQFRTHALDYDHHTAAQAIRARGLPDVYAEGLEKGLWPSGETLPPAEAAEQGIACIGESLEF